jgi:hydrogenase-4 component B
MPRVTILFVIGAAAICALPPLNGFAGELLLYIGLFRVPDLGGGRGYAVAASAAAALALIGALAAACFVKLLGTVFLGSSRSAQCEHAHDPSWSMTGPMTVFAAGCAFIGLYPAAVIPVIERAVNTWAGLPHRAMPIAAAVPLRWITLIGFVFAALVGVLFLVLKVLPRAGIAGRTGTWDCGYARPTTRMQYSGSSFGRTLLELFTFKGRPQIPEGGIRGVFPKIAEFKGNLQGTILDRIVPSLSKAADRLLPRIRIVQQGQTHMYVLYVLLITIILLVFWAAGVPS